MEVESSSGRSKSITHFEAPDGSGGKTVVSREPASRNPIFHYLYMPGPRIRDEATIEELRDFIAQESKVPPLPDTEVIILERPDGVAHIHIRRNEKGAPQVTGNTTAKDRRVK